MGQELLFLLLPLAALSGWLVGYRKRSVNKDGHNGNRMLRQDYYKGLNYLLSDQSDKALEVFIQMSELDSETVELHFALANLFVKRGEVDRAIRIHQNLIARPLLSPKDRSHALYELAKDYMRAGLLDRAESLFSELVSDDEFGQQSRWQLLDVYQQEKEWEKAISIAKRLNTGRGRPMPPLLSHFHCELADEALSHGDSTLAMKLTKRAFAEDRNSVRATLLEARIHLRNHNPRAAIKSLKRVEQQNGEYLPLILEPLQHAYEQLDATDEYVAYLQGLGDTQSLTMLLALNKQLQRTHGEEHALRILQQSLRSRPSLRVLLRTLELRKKQQPSDVELELAWQTLDKFLADKPNYHCENCGFSSKTMHWQCPSCKQWDRCKPLHGIDGD